MNKYFKSKYNENNWALVLFASYFYSSDLIKDNQIFLFYISFIWYLKSYDFRKRPLCACMQSTRKQKRVSALMDTICSGFDSEASLDYILKTAPLVDYTHNYKT